MSTKTEQLISQLKDKAAAAAKTALTIVDLVDDIEKTRRELKSRKRALWLNEAGTDKNPAITVAVTSDAGKAQHAKLCAEDAKCQDLRDALNKSEKALAIARASLAAQKREIQVIETELATYRAELNAKAAEAFGKLSSANGVQSAPVAVVG